MIFTFLFEDGLLILGFDFWCMATVGRRSLQVVSEAKNTVTVAVKKIEIAADSRVLTNSLAILSAIQASSESIIDFHFLALTKLMVFTVTSSNCKDKKARFYEFLFTLG